MTGIIGPKHKSLFWVGAISMMSMLSISPLQAYPLEVRDQQGSVILNDKPQRVVVYDLSALDLMLSLNLEVTGIPQASFPDYLQQFSDDSYVRVGTQFEPDMAALEALQPDLILIGRRSQGAYEALSQIAPTLDLTYDPEQFIGSVHTNLQVLGQAFAMEDQTAKLSAELNAALARLQDATASAQALTLFTVNNNIILHASGDRFGMLHEVTGMPSVAPPAETAATERPEPGSPEALAMAKQREARLQQAMAAEPEWLFVLDRGAATGGDGQGEQTLAEHPAVATSAAWQAGQVFYLDPPTWYVATGGYLGLMQTLEELQARFNN